jgi:hypothetical protein
MKTNPVTLDSHPDASRRSFITRLVPAKQGLMLALLLNVQVPLAVCAAPVTPDFIPSVKSLTMGAGDTTLTGGSKIHYAHPTLKNVAETLKADINIIQGLDLAVVPGGAAGKGDILLKIDSPMAGSEGYKMTVDGKVTIAVQDKKGAWPGTATLLQAIRRAGAKVANMTVIDKPDKPIRGYQIEVKQGWSMQDIKDEIRLMHLLKLNTLTLHMSGVQSAAMCLDSIPKGDPGFQVFTKADMTEIVVYARDHGVDMIPNCGLQWQYPDTQSAVNQYINQIDGLGAFPAYDEKRFHNFVKEIIKREIDIYKQGYDDGKVKGIHLGPVNGEGGMSSAEALIQVGYVKSACAATKSWFFGGMNPGDTTFNSCKDDIVQVPYSNKYDPGMRPYVDNGWNCVNITWRPLYMLSGTVSYSQQAVFETFNHHYFSGEVGTPDYINTPAAGKHVQGSMLSSWDWGTAYYLDPFLTVGPAYAEHAWNLTAFPYAASDWKAFKARYDAGYDRFSTMLRFSKGPPPPPLPPPGGSTLISESFSNTDLQGWTAANTAHSSWTNGEGFCKAVIGNNNQNEVTGLTKDNLTVPNDFTLELDMKQVSAGNPSAPPYYGVNIGGYELNVCGGPLFFCGKPCGGVGVGKYHHYRIEASGPSLKIYVDCATTPALELPRGTMPSGGLKLWILSYQGSAAFDNIVLVATGATTTPKR